MSDADKDAVDLAEYRRRRREEREARAAKNAKDDRKLIQIEAGREFEAVDAAEDAILGSGVYRFGGELVEVKLEQIFVAMLMKDDAYRYSRLSVAAILEKFSRAARFEKWDAREREWVTRSAPSALAEMYLARDGSWKVPALSGVVTCPTLRPDGSLLTAPGYDVATGLLFAPRGKQPRLSDAVPTKAEARQALDLLKKTLRTFKLVGRDAEGRSPSVSVALSGILSAVMRRSLDTVPVHAFSAPVAGAGKSSIVDIASVIACGSRAAVTSAGTKEAGDVELEKRLASSMLAGDAVIAIDNIEAPLGGDFLCQLTTQHKVKIRVLGESRNVVIPNTATIFATGNNMAVAGDMTRRALVARIDPESERPELEEYYFDAVRLAQRARPALVAAALTVLRAWRASGEKPNRPPLGSFETWSKTVRAALIWLGESDPVEVMEEVRKTDPRLAKLKTMMLAWEEVFGAVGKTTREVASACQDRKHVGEGEDGRPRWGDFVHRELRDAVTAVTGDRDPAPINAEKLAWWLRKNAGRRVGVLRFVREEVEGEKYARWCLEGARAIDVDDEPIPF